MDESPRSIILTDEGQAKRHPADCEGCEGHPLGWACLDGAQDTLLDVAIRQVQGGGRRVVAQGLTRLMSVTDVTLWGAPSAIVLRHLGNSACLHRVLLDLHAPTRG